MSAMTPAERARVLFAAEHGFCCACCDDYCPLEDVQGVEWPVLVRLTVAGVAYVSDRVIMVREDLLESGDAVIIHATAQDPSWATIPARQPAATRRGSMPSAHVLDRLERAALTLHAGDERVSHLYLDGQHAGWTMRAKDGWQCDAADLQLIREVAIAARITLTEADKAVRTVQEALR